MNAAISSSMLDLSPNLYHTLLVDDFTTSEPALTSDAIDDCRPDFVITCDPAHVDNFTIIFDVLCASDSFGDMANFGFECHGSEGLGKTVRLSGDWTPCRKAGDVLVSLGYTVVCGEGV